MVRTHFAVAGVSLFSWLGPPGTSDVSGSLEAVEGLEVTLVLPDQLPDALHS